MSRAANDNRMRMALITLDTEDGLVEAIIFASHVEYFSDVEELESRPRRHAVLSMELMHVWAKLFALAVERGYVPKD